ncbi:SPW repeat protein [Gilvimarinus sp. F26214L]|uniref:SPW repeat protein n=1 Tax=Gilvimarinus sp. DZF01 TaxID=3461371 RepID=UPI0040457BD4
MTRRWQSWMHLLMGFWLLVSPLLLAFAAGYGSTPAVNAYLTGAVLVAVNIVALTRPATWQEWVSLAIGAWLLLSSFVLGVAEDQLVMWNNLISGLVVVLGAVSALNWIRARQRS